MFQVSLKNISKSYGSFNAVYPLDLDIRKGEFLTLLGPSGCGKTTTLRLMAGFLSPTEGSIWIGGKNVTQTPPQRRQIGMVFQDYALFPHLTIRQNISFGLVERRVERSEAAARVEEMLRLIRLPDVGDRYPAEISGGQQQRVAVARAVAYPPEVLLMDEPLGALDLKLREAMQAEIRNLQQSLGITTVYVTHDQNEAMTMSDRIAIMNNGKVEQIAAPQEIYRHPANRFVAEFVGRVNLLEGQVEEQSGPLVPFRSRAAQLKVPRLSQSSGGPDCTLALRPEKLRIARNEGQIPPGAERVKARVLAMSFVGTHWAVDVGLAGDVRWTVDQPDDGDPPAVGEEVSIYWHAQDAVMLAS